MSNHPTKVSVVSVGLSFPFSLKHRLEVPDHSPNLHGHNVKICIKARVDQASPHERAQWNRLIKDSILPELLATYQNCEGPEASTESLLNGLVHKITFENKHSSLAQAIEEIHIQETPKNQFLWKRQAGNS